MAFNLRNARVAKHACVGVGPRGEECEEVQIVPRTPVFWGRGISKARVRTGRTLEVARAWPVKVR